MLFIFATRNKYLHAASFLIAEVHLAFLKSVSAYLFVFFLPSLKSTSPFPGAASALEGLRSIFRERHNKGEARRDRGPEGLYRLPQGQGEATRRCPRQRESEAPALQQLQTLITVPPAPHH